MRAHNRNYLKNVGIPMILLIVGSSYGISEFLQTSFEQRDKSLERKVSNILIILFIEKKISISFISFIY